MSCFPDTSFLCSLYRRQIHTPRAIAFMGTIGQPLPVSTFLLLEFRQSVRLQARLFSLDRSKGYPESDGRRMLEDLQSDVDAGVVEVMPVDWSVVHRLAESLSAKHTKERGHRLADILHVATALHLGARDFLTFDANQKALAKEERMTVPI